MARGSENDGARADRVVRSDDASSPRVSRIEPAKATSTAIPAAIVVGAVSRLAADVVVADAIVRADRIII